MSFQAWEVVWQHGVTQHSWGVLGQLRGEDIAGLSSIGAVQSGLHALGSLVLDNYCSGHPAWCMAVLRGVGQRWDWSLLLLLLLGNMDGHGGPLHAR